MNKEKMKYIEIDSDKGKVIQPEKIFAPLLISLPLLVGTFFIYDWYIRGFSVGYNYLNGELFLGIIIIGFSLLFDIPFIRSLKKKRK